MSWHHQHVVGHHVHTNVFGSDPDLPVAKEGDLRRIVPKQFWAPAYRYQHWYLPVLYSLLGLKFRVQDIMNTWLEGMNGPIRVNHYSNPWLRMVATKLVWAAWRIGYPLAVAGVPHASFWPLFLVTELASGAWLAWNFQVSHVTEDVAWPNGGGKGDCLEGAGSEKKTGAGAKKKTAQAADPLVVPDSWAVSQVKTSLDYGHGDALQTFLCGALNYQVEHHLFPGVSQYHYPAIAPIVKQTCKEFGIPFRYEPTFWAAWLSHWRYLRDLGQQGKAAHWDA
jgi:fatty acid desaturase